MKNDPLHQFIAIRTSLLEEKAELLARLSQIEKALGTDKPQAPARTVPDTKSPARVKSRKAAKKNKSPRKIKITGTKPAPKARARVRRREGPGLREVIRQMVATTPLTKAEIIDGLKKAGRDFTENYLAVTLYKKGNFKRVDGRFSVPA